jgi:dGTPase
MNWSQLLCTKRARQAHRVNPNDLRSEFQKDYHRIIGSASFRRLQDKTQVFPLDKSDFVRTRLTHSLEVSSFAKSLGQTIFEGIMRSKLDPEVTAKTKEDICSVLECAGLIHDIGNPPFGHFGEEAIREWFKRRLPTLTYNGKPLTELLTPQMQSDFYNFEGNAQALRLLSKLHFLVDAHGMNLTFALLNTIIKYPVASTEINKHSGNIKDKKMGWFLAEKELFEQITSETGANGNRYPLTFILEAADDIAYKTADIEDACKKGIIPFDVLISELKSSRYTDMCATEGEKSTYSDAVEKLEHYRNKAAKLGIASSGANAVQNWAVYVQLLLLNNASDSFIKHYSEIMHGEFKTELLTSSNASVLSYALSDIATRFVFMSKPIQKLEIGEGTMLDFLLDKFVPAAIEYSADNSAHSINQKLMAMVSENYKYIYNVYSENCDENTKLYLRLMLVTDFVCGMTDSYAKNLYLELNGIS